MSTPPREERLRQACAAAAERLARSREQAGPRAGPPGPGDLYVFPLDVEAALEWLVVLEHPDDRGLLLAVPADDFPLAGTPDVAVAREQAGRPLTVRCGEGLWLSAAHFAPRS